METLLRTGRRPREIERLTGVGRKTIDRIAREIAGTEGKIPQGGRPGWSPALAGARTASG